MDVTQEMFGIFNVETGELLRGPFKSVRGAANSRSAVIDTAIQTYMLDACDRFCKQIQVRPVVVTMTMGELTN